MDNNKIYILNEIFDENDGKYSCNIYFNNSNKSIQEKFIKQHIIKLNYSHLNFIFDPQLGSIVNASKHIDNENNVKIEVSFIKFHRKSRKNKKYKCCTNISCPPPPKNSPENSPPPYIATSNLTSFANLQDIMWIKELQQHPEYATLNLHPHYNSFKHSILCCTNELSKKYTYDIYCETL